MTLLSVEAMLMKNVEDLEVLLAWQAGVLTEGQVCELLDVKAEVVRAMLQNTLDAARDRWREHVDRKVKG